jgi:PGF-pre-PGF domain-containing protein
MKVNHNNKSIFTSTFITLIIVGMLIFSGPAQAVSVLILGLQDQYPQGSNVKFQVKININDIDRFVPISNVSLDLTGPISKNRTFLLNGAPISGDDNIIIEPVLIPKPADFGYGHGYGYDFGYGYDDFGYGYDDFGYGYDDFGYGYDDFGYGYDDFGYGYGFDFGYGYGYGYGYGGYGYGGGGGELSYIYNVTIKTADFPAGKYSVTAKLNTGNTAKPSFRSVPAPFTIIMSTGTGSSDGGSGSSTGSGGVTSKEPLENIIKSETMDCRLFQDKPFTCRFSTPEHGISELLVTGKESEIAAFRIEALRGLSPNVDVEAPGTKYINIWSGTDKITEALIRFRLENSWIASEGLTSENVRMYRWDGTNWNMLETRMLSTDTNSAYYEAKTNDFSYFAISGERNIQNMMQTSQEMASTLTPDPDRTTTVTPGEVQRNPIDLKIIIGIIALIAIVIILYLKRRIFI